MNTFLIETLHNYPPFVLASELLTLPQKQVLLQQHESLIMDGVCLSACVIFVIMFNFDAPRTHRSIYKLV